MNLDTTTRSLEFLLSGAVTTNQLEYVGSYVDVNQTSLEVTAMSTVDGTSNGATAVTAFAAPAATTTRKIKELTIYNKDTVAAVVTVRLNDNGTFRIKLKVSLAVGDTLMYTDES
jgi:hypothetical protein